MTAAAKEKAWTEAQLANPAVCRAALDACYALLQHEREVHEARETEAMAQTTRAQQRFHRMLGVYEAAKDLLTAMVPREGTRVGELRDRLEAAVWAIDSDVAAARIDSAWAVFDTWDRKWRPERGTEAEMGAHATKLNALLRRESEEPHENTYRYQPLRLPSEEDGS